MTLYLPFHDEGLLTINECSKVVKVSSLTLVSIAQQNYMLSCAFTILVTREDFNSFCIEAYMSKPLS